jgi:hypothetical protein
VHARSIGRSLTWGALVVLGFLTLTPVWAQDRTYPSDALCKREQRCRECSGSGCVKVATPAPWPEERVEEGTGPFIMGSLFKVMFPKGANQYLVLADGDITAKYGPDRWVGIQVVTAAETHFPEREGQKNTRPNALAHADMPRILHSKTLDDAEPAHIEDRRIWRSAIMYKGVAFKEATQITAAERGALTAYLSDARIAGGTTVGYVTHRRLKDSYLLVQTKGFSFDDFRRVIGSIEALRE